MTKKSPLDDPQNAAFAWARYRRIMRFMLLLTVGIVAIAMALLFKFGEEEVSVHFYIAVALGIGFTMLLTSALMGLVFLSSGTGHDESVEDPLRRYCATGSPPIRCCWRICSSTSGRQEWYQTLSGQTTAIGPASQTCRQSALVRCTVPSRPASPSCFMRFLR